MTEPILKIPKHILQEILARLPPNAVIQCSCVCKTWRELISEAEFVNLHLSKSPKGLIVSNSLHRSANSVTYILVEVEDEANHQSVLRFAKTNREFPRSREDSFVTMIGSIDGLVCIKLIEPELIRVWNPITGEFITVLQSPANEEHKFIDKKHKLHNVTTYGFGISSGKYLVVKILQRINMDYDQLIHDSTCYVYTIGDGIRKSIGPAPWIHGCGRHGFFFNGNLHWCYEQGRQISCLDLEKMLFQPFPILPEMDSLAFATLNVYKGCLSLCYRTDDMDSDIVIWAMKKYGVHTSWSREVVISRPDQFDLYRRHRILPMTKVFKDGEIMLFRSNNHKLFLYHRKRKIIQDMDVNNHTFILNSNAEAIDYVPSLVSLKNLGEVNVSR